MPRGTETKNSREWHLSHELGLRETVKTLCQQTLDSGIAHCIINVGLTGLHLHHALRTEIRTYGHIAGNVIHSAKVDTTCYAGITCKPGGSGSHTCERRHRKLQSQHAYQLVELLTTEQTFMKINGSPCKR